MNSPNIDNRIPLALLGLSIFLILLVTGWCVGVGLAKKDWFPYNKYTRKNGPKGTVSAKDYKVHEEHNL